MQACPMVKKFLYSASLLASVLICAQESVYEPISFSTPLMHFTGAGKAEVLVKGGPNGERCNKISTTQVNKHRWEATRYKILGRKNYQLWGEKIKYSFSVKGKGVLQVICMNRGDRDSAYAAAEILPLKDIQLSQDWQRVDVAFDCLSPRFGRNAYITFKMAGEGNYFILALEKLQSLPPSGSSISVSPKHLITYPGEKAAVTFSFPKKAKVSVFDGSRQFEQQVSNSLSLDVTGKVSPGKIAPGTRIPGVGRVSVYDPATGQHAAVFINCIPKKEYDELDAAAKKIRLDRNLSVLFLGDSLTDYDRSRNYTDKLAFWINKYNPGKFSFRNAGVGGDHIVSLHNRLTGDPRTWRKNMYQDLFKKKYDLIFIFLGHNDTRAHYRTDGKVYQPVPSEIQAQYWRKTIQFLRSKSKAEIILISPSASDFQMCLKAASYNKKAGKNYVIFGEAPRVKEYFDIQKQIAKEFDLKIIDIYSPLEKMSPKSHLFTIPDGVHLSSSGNNYLSLHLLRFFSR